MTDCTLILMVVLSKAPISISTLDIFKSDYCQKCIKEKKNIYDKQFFFFVCFYLYAIWCYNMQLFVIIFCFYNKKRIDIYTSLCK